MINKDLVNKLIYSENCEDVELGIEYSFHLDFKDFADIFKNDIHINRNGDKWFAFGRRNTEVHITLNIICVYNKLPLDRKHFTDDIYNSNQWKFKGYKET